MVTLSVKGFEAALANVKNAPKQLRFAMTQTLNAAAKEIQSDTVGGLLPEKFTLRARGAAWQKPGTPLGFNIRPFAKAKDVDPVAVVGSRANWLGLQELGGTKTSGTGKALTLPVEGTVARKTPRAVVSARFKPRALLAGARNAKRVAGRRPRGKSYFVLKFKGSGQSAVLERFKRGKGGTRVIWFFEDQASVVLNLGFTSRATKVARARVKALFPQYLRATLATAR